jgi:hypothetical protein
VIRTLLLLGLSATFVCTSSAALTWKHLRVEEAAIAGDDHVTAIYPFKNDGITPVRIVSARASCECTKVEIPISYVNPGETGEIKAIFTVGDRLGRQEKTILVSTDEPAEKPTTLTLRVTIAEIITCTPRLVVWKLGSAPDEKFVELTAAGSHTIEHVQLPPESAAFSAELQTVENGKAYRIRLKPHTTATPSRLLLHCKGKVEGRPEVNITIDALVR